MGLLSKRPDDDDGYLDSKYPTKGRMPDEEIDQEPDFVYMWRFQQLWDAGYDSLTAEVLAETDSDLHKMCDAKKAGMSDHEALLIFV